MKNLGALPANTTDLTQKSYVDGLVSVLTATQGALSADVALTTSNTWYDGPSVALSIGTYLVLCNMTYWKTATTAANVFGRLTDGTNYYASGQFYHTSLAGVGGQLFLASKVTLTVAATLKGQMTTSAGASTAAIKAAMTANGAGNNASIIVALRLGS